LESVSALGARTKMPANFLSRVAFYEIRNTIVCD
jgi:hypothetical protein